ncbi:Gfo/Idh/MocA family protein, partial [Planctomycetota bacterium]
MAVTQTKRKKATRKKTRPRTIRVAFIGAGGRATGSHYSSIRDIKGAAICGIAELDEERMKKAAATFGVKSTALYTDYKQMIEREKPDVVYAIMKPHLLFEVAATVMEMGRHLVIEKPPAVTCEQTRQLAIIARKNKVLSA